MGAEASIGYQLKLRKRVWGSLRIPRRPEQQEVSPSSWLGEEKELLAHTIRVGHGPLVHTELQLLLGLINAWGKDGHLHGLLHSEEGQGPRRRKGLRVLLCCQEGARPRSLHLLILLRFHGFFCYPG